MCGIAGIVSLNKSGNYNSEIVEALNCLKHRGPDDSGKEMFITSTGYVYLGQTRLSIIDLSSGGHQPMFSNDGRYVVVFNGEIYNYRELRLELTNFGYHFKTDSDTEVLLAGWTIWNVNCLKKFIGMFSFAILDIQTECLFIVRDAFGIKPLYYCCKDERVFFASEIPAILKFMSQRPSINLQTAYDYLVYGSYDNGEDTFYQNIYHLLPGHYIKVNLESCDVEMPKRWWFPSIQENSTYSFADAADKLRELFLNNIKLHLRSDVPVGAALSGGLDSSAVVCAMRYLEPDMPIHTFTYVAKNTSVDEEKWADLVNQHVGALSHKIILNERDLISDLDEMIKVQGEPFGGTSIYAQYRVYKMAKQEGIIVTLDGQGADELLAGYNGYPQGYIHSLLEKGELISALKFLSKWSKWPGRNIGHAIKMFGSVVTPDKFRNLAYHMINRNPSPDWLNKDYLLKEGIKSIPPRFLKIEKEGKRRRLVEQLRSSLVGFGLSQLLRHGDRNSMRWSIESRVPFLTIEMAEFLLSLPESYLLSPNGETKSIFRAAMRGIVPDSILDRKDKIGFQTPEYSWLFGLKNEINKWIDISPTDVPFIDLPKLKIELNDMLDGKIRFTSQAWRMINYCRWIQLQSSTRS